MVSGLLQYQPFWIAQPSLPGLPTLSAPAGRTADGLPVGIQIIGPMDEDHGDHLCRAARRGNRRIYTATDHEHETLNRQSWPIGNLFPRRGRPCRLRPCRAGRRRTFGTLMQRIQAHDATHQAQGPQVSMLTPCFSGSGRSVSMASSAARDRSTCSRVKDRCAWWEGPEAGDWSSGQQVTATVREDWKAVW